METMLCRLKPFDPRRGHVLRRFTYRGIKIHEERGWYRVDKETAEYLRTVRQVHSDEHAPPRFRRLHRGGGQGPGRQGEGGGRGPQVGH